MLPVSKTQVSIHRIEDVLDAVLPRIKVDKVWFREWGKPAPTERVSKHGFDTQPVRSPLPGWGIFLYLFYTLEIRIEKLAEILM